MSTFGEELKRERELREISLREVSEATKINLRYLEAMESNDFASLPGGLFNRGFVRAYAQYIGVDPESMVNAYLMEQQQQAGGGDAPDRRLLRGGRRNQKTDPASAVTGREGRRLWWIWIAVVLLIAAGIYVAYRWLAAGPAAPTKTRAHVSIERRVTHIG